VADVISGKHGIDWAAPPGGANLVTGVTARDLGNRQSLLAL
jgi:hypothetical protein